MISKELLNAVYPIDETTETYVGIQESTGRVMWFGKEHNDCRSEIDIHRVAHKCKKWALKHHYKVISKPDNVPGLWKAYVNLSLTSKHGEVADTEPEAIFKACQWILTKDSK